MANPGKPIDEISGVETTGHEWDGLRELNNPLPRWWLIIFWLTILWAVGYMVLMPALPAPPWAADWGATPGLRGNSERVNVRAELDALKAQRAAGFEKLKGASLAQIEADPDLLAFVLRAGETTFADNCATCHGRGGGGARGYPNLRDDVWLWGGGLDDIRQTLRYGVRTEHKETRFTLMPAYGRDALLTPAEISDLVEHVRALSGQEADAEAARRAAPLFAAQCASCHGADGKGDQKQGAPNLTDQDWLYGGDAAAIQESIWNSRAGVMPAWTDRLEPQMIDALAVYVHALAGGERE